MNKEPLDKLLDANQVIQRVFDEINDSLRIVGGITGTLRPSGLNTGGKITEVELNSTTWTALPLIPLANRNAINVQNFSGVEVKINYVDSALGIKASETDGGIIFLADNYGTSGNSIVLTFNGSDTLDDVVGAWNTANPSNTLTHTGSGTIVLDPVVVSLSGGVNAVGYVGAILTSGAERFYDITDTIELYGKASAGTPTIIVEEIA